MILIQPNLTASGESNATSSDYQQNRFSRDHPIPNFSRLLLIEIPGAFINLIIITAFLRTKRALTPTCKLSMLICALNLTFIGMFEVDFILRYLDYFQHKSMKQVLSTIYYFFLTYFIQLLVVTKTAAACNGIVRHRNMTARQMKWACFINMMTALWVALSNSPLVIFGLSRWDERLYYRSSLVFTLAIISTEFVILLVIIVFSILKISSLRLRLISQRISISTVSTGDSSEQKNKTHLSRLHKSVSTVKSKSEASASRKGPSLVGFLEIPRPKWRSPYKESSEGLKTIGATTKKNSAGSCLSVVSGPQVTMQCVNKDSLTKDRNRIAINMIVSQLPLIFFRIPYVIIGEQLNYHNGSEGTIKSIRNMILVNMNLSFFAFNSLVFLATSSKLREEALCLLKSIWARVTCRDVRYQNREMRKRREGRVSVTRFAAIRKSNRK